MSIVMEHRRLIFSAVPIVLILTICISSIFAKEVISKPNVVFIMADDLGWHQLGCYGSTFYETPNIDGLAKEGMKFTNAYAAAPICSPTRASIMTGKYPARLHLTDFLGGKRLRGNQKNKRLITPDWQKHLPLEEITIPESLKGTGYATGHFGKWHLNQDKKYKPGRRGDPGSQGFDDVLTTHKPTGGPESKFDQDWHHVREITERSIAFIQKNKDKPFFCYVTHNSIHDPELEKKALIEKYAIKRGADSKGRKNPVQAAMLETLDQSIGRILKTLKELRLERSTLVIFFSDNGQLGPKKGNPFRGSKADLYEGGIRMPFIVKWPIVAKKGTVCDEIVISNDFFPTFNDIAGVTSAGKGIDGVSILPLLKDSKARLSRKSVYWHYPHYHGSGLGPQSAMRHGRYKLVEWLEKSAYGENDAFELYDLLDDPAEQINLASTMPMVMSDLRKELQGWRQQVGAQIMLKRNEGE